MQGSVLASWLRKLQAEFVTRMAAIDAEMGGSIIEGGSRGGSDGGVSLSVSEDVPDLQHSIAGPTAEETVVERTPPLASSATAAPAPEIQDLTADVTTVTTTSVISSSDIFSGTSTSTQDTFSDLEEI